MAFGKGSGNIFPQGTKIYYVRIKTKDLPKPVFEVSIRKEDKTYEVVDAAAEHVSGNLIDVRNKSNKHGNKEIKSVGLTFHDPSAGEGYYVDVPHTYLGRNLMNGLLGIDATKGFNDLDIGLYQSKPKANAPAGSTGFASVSLRQSGVLIYGKLKNEELPPIPKIKINGEMVGDVENITAFFIQHIEELSKVVKASAPKLTNANQSSDAGNETGGVDQTPDNAQAEDDGVPF